MSPHLRARNQVAFELQQGNYATTILRAAIIVGSGSASYEILKHLVVKCPIFLIPFWARTKCQPISIRSLINILVGVLETNETSSNSYDIGGDEVLTYEDMLKTFSGILNKRKIYIHTSFSSVRFYSYIASLLTPVPAAIIRSFMKSCYNEVICKKDNIFPISLYQPVMFKEAILKAMSREELDSVHTRWSDEYPRAHELTIKLNELNNSPKYISSYSILSDKNQT
ncbi:MAG: hypothetical protein KAR17_06350, partial [Cyclobacteriaceae bacterium]|nr:hypothetical protein [Cyclobacteriaceae bacterium]